MERGEYFGQLHIRLNHVQTLQTFVTNVISSAAVALPALITLALRMVASGQSEIRLAPLLEAAFMPTYCVVMATLLWAQLVSLYQTFCVFKLAKILGELEIGIHGMQPEDETAPGHEAAPEDGAAPGQRLANPPYFPHGGMRRFYYALIHLLPSLYLVLIPALTSAFGYKHLTGLPGPWPLAGSSLGIVVGTGLLWTLLLFRVFYYRLPLLFYMRPSCGGIATAGLRAREERDRNLAKVKAKKDY